MVAMVLISWFENHSQNSVSGSRIKIDQNFQRTVASKNRSRCDEFKYDQFMENVMA